MNLSTIHQSNILYFTYLMKKNSWLTERVDHCEKQPPFNYRSAKKERHPASERSRGKECRGQNRKTTVSQVDNQGSDFQSDNPSNALYPSTNVQQRVVAPIHNFSDLIFKEMFSQIEKDARVFGTCYTGQQHAMYATSVKDFTYNQHPLNTEQSNQLLLLLKKHHPIAGIGEA